MPIGKPGKTKFIGYRRQIAPTDQIRGAHDRVNARRAAHRELKEVGGPAERNNANCQRIAEHDNALTLQSKISAKGRRIQRLWRYKCCEWIGQKAERNQISHVRGQRQSGDLIGDEEKPRQIGEAERQCEAGERILADVEGLQLAQIWREYEVGQLIAGQIEPGQIGQARWQRKCAKPVAGQAERAQIAQVSVECDVGQWSTTDVQIGQRSKSRGHV